MANDQQLQRSRSHAVYSALKRAILEQAPFDAGYWKVFLLEHLSRRGVRFLFEPELVVECIQDSGFGEFARRYFRNARAFAAARPHRLAHLATTPLLPVLLFYRRMRALKGHKKRWPVAPLIAVLVVYWSAGEFLGYLTGSPDTHAK